MLANLDFSDFTTILNGGLPPGTSLATGTTSGTVITIVGTGVRKLAFRLQSLMGSASGTLQMYLATATVSSGTFVSLSQTLVSVAVSIASSASRYVTVTDTRGECLQAICVQPVFIVTGAAMAACLEVLGYNVGNLPGKNQNAANVVYNETIAMQ